jgi:hypothetical protein
VRAFDKTNGCPLKTCCLTLAFYFCLAIYGHSQAIYTVQNGRWLDSTTWDIGRPPMAGDSIWIRHHVEALETVHILQGSFFKVDTMGVLCMPDDSLLFECGSYCFNVGVIVTKWLHAHDGQSNGCIWWPFLWTPCDTTTHFHFYGWNCDAIPAVCQPSTPAQNAPVPIYYPQFTTVLYPNPTIGDATLSIIPAALPTGDEYYTFSLYDMLGKLILVQKRLVFGGNPIPLPSNLAKGSYLWQLEPAVKIAYGHSVQGILLVR